MDGNSYDAEYDEEPVAEDTVDAAQVPTVVQLAFDLASLALQFAWNITRVAAGLVQPFIPQLVPLLICVLLLPLLIFLSLSAGFVVWSSSAVSWQEPVYLQYGDGVTPYADLRLNVAANQPYDVSLHLVVPTVSSNYDLGNFMTSLHVSTPSNRTVVHVRRPALILPSVAKSLPFFSKKPVMELDIPLLKKHAMGSSRILARVEVGRRDHWKTIGDGAGRELTVLSATLRGAVRHRGVRGIFSRFPLFTASVASVTFFGITLAVVALFLLSSTQLFTNYNAPADAPSSSLTGAIEASSPETQEKPLRRRSSKRKSVDVKLESDIYDIPPADADAKPLRRRLSRQLKDEDDPSRA